VKSTIQTIGCGTRQGEVCTVQTIGCGTRQGEVCTIQTIPRNPVGCSCINMYEEQNTL